MLRPENVFATGPGFIEGVFIADRLLYKRLEWEKQIALIRHKGVYIDGVLVEGTAGWSTLTVKHMYSDAIQNDFEGDLAHYFESQVHALRAGLSPLISFL
jgi:hypothetical protein